MVHVYINCKIANFNSTAQLVTFVHPLAVVQLRKHTHLLIETPFRPNMLNIRKQYSRDFWDAPLDLSHLGESQSQMVCEMLREEINPISPSDNDITQKFKLKVLWNPRQ